MEALRIIAENSVLNGDCAPYPQGNNQTEKPMKFLIVVILPYRLVFWENGIGE